MIGDDGWGKESRKLEPTVTVWSDHHGDLDLLIPQSGDAPGPLAFDRASPFELEAELDEKRDRGVEGLHHDADVVHPLKRHAADCNRLHTVVSSVTCGEGCL